MRHVREGLLEPGIVETEMTTRKSTNAPDARDAKELGFLLAADVAQTVRFMVDQSPRVAIHEILLRPTEQAI